MKRVLAVVGGDINIFELSAKSIERLRCLLSIKNPDYERRQALRLSLKDIPPSFDSLIEHTDGSVSVPRGSVLQVKATLLKDDVCLQFEDLRTLGTPIQVLNPPLVSELQLRPYQADALSAMQIDLQGTVVMPCGGGKTSLGIAAIRRIGLKSIIFVHTNDLLDQWTQDIKKYLGIDAGTIKGGEFIDGPVVVAMVMTTLNLVDIDTSILNNFGLCIVDEAHRVPSNTYTSILPHLRAKYRFGLTATPDREDGRSKQIEWAFGKRLYEIDTKTLVHLGYLMMPELIQIQTEFRFTSKTIDDLKRMQELRSAIVKDKDRNELIVQLVKDCVDRGEYVALLSNDRAHCRLLGRLLFEAGTDPHVLVSEGSSKKAKAKRSDTIDGMRDGKIQLIIATSLLDEGINIQRLSVVVLALPHKAKGGTQQRTGRTMRVFQGKAPKVYDIIDSHVGTLARRFNDRKQVYREMGILD